MGQGVGARQFQNKPQKARCKKMHRAFRSEKRSKNGSIGSFSVFLIVLASFATGTEGLAGAGRTRGEASKLDVTATYASIERLL